MYTQLNAVKNHGTESTGISKYFIDRMGGSVSAEGVYGKGSIFFFTVPQKIGDPKKLPRNTAENEASPYSFTAMGAAHSMRNERLYC